MADVEVAQEEVQQQTAAEQQASRGEKKARKTIQKLGLKPVPGIQRVTIKKSQNIAFNINNPDVYKSQASDTYVIFGVSKADEGGFSGFPGLDALAGAGADLGAEDAQEEDEEDDDEEVDETGVSAEDINTLVAQTGCSRSKAVKTLKETGGLVDALIALSPQ